MLRKTDHEHDKCCGGYRLMAMFPGHIRMLMIAAEICQPLLYTASGPAILHSQPGILPCLSTDSLCLEPRRRPHKDAVMLGAFFAISRDTLGVCADRDATAEPGMQHTARRFLP